MRRVIEAAHERDFSENSLKILRRGFDRKPEGPGDARPECAGVQTVKPMLLGWP